MAMGLFAGALAVVAALFAFMSGCGESDALGTGAPEKATPRASRFPRSIWPLQVTFVLPLLLWADSGVRRPSSGASKES